METVQEGIKHEAATVRAGAVALVADLALPEPVKGIILFAHGHCSGRRSSPA